MFLSTPSRSSGVPGSPRTHAASPQGHMLRAKARACTTDASAGHVVLDIGTCGRAELGKSNRLPRNSQSVNTTQNVLKI